MLARLTKILRGLNVYPGRMLENINKSFGLYNSQRVMLALIEKGMSRENAYQFVQRSAMESWSRKKDFKEILKEDKEIKQYLSSNEITKLFNLSYYTKNVNYIFRRVFK
jgi:adenylosuccinate lyase